MQARIAALRDFSQSLKCSDYLKAHCRSFTQRKPATRQAKATKEGSKEPKASAKSDAPARGKVSKAAEKEKPEAKAKSKDVDKNEKNAAGGEKKVSCNEKACSASTTTEETCCGMLCSKSHL